MLKHMLFHHRRMGGSINEYIRLYSMSLNYAIAPDKKAYPLEGIRVLDLTRIGRSSSACVFC